MEIAKIPLNEKERIASLHSYNILYTDFEKQYDEIVNLASYICDTPIAVISLVDNDKQWYKAKVGVEARETSRDVAFCAHAINLEDTLIVNDTLNDNRFFDNPLVIGDPNIRFYAGAQLRTKDGHVLGALCAIDKKPRELNQQQLNALKVLSQQVMTMLELRKSYVELEKHANDLYEQNNLKSKLFRIISHDLRSPFHSILGLSEILCEDIEELTKDEIKNLSQNITETATDSFDLVNNGKDSTSGTGGEKGTGLGFTIAKDFIDLSGGKIEIESERNLGTNVIVPFE